MKDWKEKLKKKENLFVLILVGILLMVISLPVDNKKKVMEETEKEISQEETIQQQEEQLERRLEKILGKVEGVGKAEVMITLKSKGEKIVEKDMESSENVTQEKDAQGGERKTSDYSKKESTVFAEKEDGGSEPYVIKEIEPEIEGILVIAEGGDKPSVEKNISDAVLALFPIEAHKIKVMKSVNE